MVLKASEIKSKRQVMEYSQEYCSSVIGVSRRQWIRWEQHHASPHPIFELKIRKLLGMDMPNLRKHEKAPEEWAEPISM